MRHVIKTEPEWRAIRQRYVTASEAAVLVGLDPYSSPAKIKNPEPFSGNAFTKVGNVLEPVVVKIVNDILGTSFKLYETPEGHKEFYTEEYLGATPDAHMNHSVLLECKTTRPNTYIKYSSVPPYKYLVQLLVQMICTGIAEGYLAILSTNLTQHTTEIQWPIKIYKMWKDERLCDILKEEAEKFTLNKTFRVDSKVKQKTKLLLSLSYEEVK